MPVKGFKCKYCTDFFMEEDEAIRHEDSCSFNPKKKGCFTCQWMIYDFEMEVCRKNCKKFIESWPSDVSDCPEWKGHND